MKYEVVWTTNAENHLATIWNAATDQRAVSVAAHVVDQELSRRPLAVGDRRSSSVHRVVYRAPLAVEYEVVEDDNRVIVQAVFEAQP